MKYLVPLKVYFPQREGEGEREGEREVGRDRDGMIEKERIEREKEKSRLISGKGLREKEQMNVIQTSFYKRLRTHSRKILKMEHDKISFIRSSFYYFL